MTEHWHPDELDLTDLVINGTARPEVAEHVLRCAECALDLEQLRRDREPWSPAATVAAESQAPRSGQVWRVRWQGTAELVAVVSVRDDANEVDIAPVLDSSIAVPGRIRIEELGSGVAVWPVRTTLPMRVFDRFVDELAPETYHAVGTAAPGAVEIADVFAPGALDAADLLDRLEFLAAATWIPTTADPPAHPQLVESFATPSALAAALGVSAGEARRILGGQRALTADERHHLQRFVPGISAASAVDPHIVWAMDRPEVRPLWEAAATAAGTTDSPAYRLEMYTSGQFAIAARTTSISDPRQQALARVKAVLGGRA